MKPILKSFTLSINITSDDNQFPQTMSFSDKNIYGVCAHLQNATDTRTDVTGSLLIEKDASVFVRLEGTENCDSKVLHVPIESLVCEGNAKDIPYIPLSIGKIMRENCSIKVMGSGGTKNGTRVCMLTFITD